MSNSSWKPFLLGAAIVAVGIVGLIVLVLLRPDPPKEDREELAPLVRVTEAEARSGVVTVSGSGSVAPIRQTQLAAQVGGTITDVHPSFYAGGYFSAGDVLVQIDSTDYVLAVDAAEAEVTQARYNLIVARQESEVAREEYESLQSRGAEVTRQEDSELGNLVFREPQIRLAESALQAARSRLQDAQLRLERTSIRAPFNGMVRAKTAELGQFVGPGTPVATFYATDAVEISVPMTSADAALIDGLFENVGRGSVSIDALVTLTVEGDRYEWPGRVHRVDGALDPGTRTLRVVVRVPDPYEVSGDRPPLFVGSFATVTIDARRLDSYVRVPVNALHENPEAAEVGADPLLLRDQVWTVENGRLRFRPVRVIRETDEYAVITEGLSGGEQVVVSQLDVVTDSMAVRIE